MESAGVRYLRTRCCCIRNLTRSLRSLVRFRIRQQLVRKYRTPALSIKASEGKLMIFPVVKDVLQARSTFTAL